MDVASLDICQLYHLKSSIRAEFYKLKLKLMESGDEASQNYIPSGGIDVEKKW